MIPKLFYRFLFVTFLLAPSFVLASGTATIGALAPGGTVGVGTRLSFSMIVSGFTNPTYRVTDSFAGGVSTSNIDLYGNLSWTPNQDDIGAHTITVAVSDSFGNSASASQYINVVKPSISVSQLSPSATVQYGNPVTFQINNTGFLGAIYSVVDSFYNSSLGSFNINSAGRFYWLPLLRDIGSHTLTVTARDIPGHVATVSQTIVVEGLPSVSVIEISPGTSIGVGQTLSFGISPTSFSNPTITVTDSFYSGGATSTLVLSDSKVSWTPVYNDIGAHNFVVLATDSAGHSASTQLRVMVAQYATIATPAPKTTEVITTTAASAPTQTQAPVVANVSAVSTVFKSFLHRTSRGAEVTALQQKLTELGFYDGPVTGYFGPLTAQGVKNLQGANGIETVGYVGPMTRAALNK